MRGPNLRYVSAILLAAACAAIVTWCGDQLAAQPAPAPVAGGVKVAGKGKDKDKEKEKDFRPLRDLDLPFGFPYERDAQKQLAAAREYLAFKVIPWNRVCPSLQKILDSRSDSFFDIEYKVGDKLEINRISVKTEANRIIAAFDKDGLEYYQQTYGQSAAALLEEAIKNNYDLPTLAEVTQRYFHTRAGAEATVLVGTLYLERGSYLEAAYAFERLLARPNSDEVFTPRTLFKAALAFRRSADPRHVALARTTTERLQRAIARDGLVIGRRTFTLAQVMAELDRSVEAVRSVATGIAWAGRYGNLHGNAVADGGPPFLIPSFRPAEMLIGKTEASTWIRDQLEKLYDPASKTNKSLPLPAFFPVTTTDSVYFRTYDGVYALATRDHTVLLAGQPTLRRAGEVEWVSPASCGTYQLLSSASDPTRGVIDPQTREEVTARWWPSYQSTPAGAGVLVENPLVGSLAHDGQNLYYIDDLAIPPPPPMLNDGNPFGNMPQPQQSPGKLTMAIRASELIAIDMQTGLRVWVLGRVFPPSPGSKNAATPLPLPLTEEEADTTASAFRLCLNAIFLGPPMPSNGRLYVMIELDGVVRLLCLDPKALVDVPGLPKAPTLLWSQKLGKPTTPLPGESLRRYQSAFLASGEGIIVCPTNSGAIVGVDEMSHSLLWAYAYRKLDPQPTNRGFNPNMVAPQQLPVERWRAAAPIIAGGRVLVAAYDSRTLDCLDIRTGKLHWSIPRAPGDLYVGGVVDDKVLVVGKSEVTAYRITGEDPATSAPKKLWTAPLASAVPTGHGAMGKTAYYLPVRNVKGAKEAIPSAEVWAINLETGEIGSKTVARKRVDGGGAEIARYGLGNLVFQDGLVIAQSPWELAVYPQLESMKAETDRRIAANPNDPVGLLFRGELLLDSGNLTQAIADFKAAERNNLPLEYRAAHRDKLYAAYTELLQKNFATGEPILAEYEGLCEVPLDTDDPLEKARREDESLRRRRLYRYLLARGREDQGRLSDAFTEYLALVRIGATSPLTDTPEEADLRVRPDIWARGRLEGMVLRAATPAARKVLDDRIAAEWAAVRSGTDLEGLRTFVEVFASISPAGPTANLTLADALLRTNEEKSITEAMVQLARLRSSTADRTLRARATEALASALDRAGLSEDAVALYLELGKDFPDLIIRDGKTGADFVSDVLTDKRRLPYLEPTRSTLPPRVRVSPEAPLAGARSEFEVEPEGDLFPMFRRLRFVIDTAPTGNGSWSLRAYDRITGADRGRFMELAPPPINNPGGATARVVQGNGQLLLVQLGSWVYCLDLAEKKEKWRKNLFGDSTPQGPNQFQQIQDTGDEVSVVSPDGYRINLGKSAIIQSGYICLLTRDGLEAFDPNTSRPLWVRRHIAERTAVYGDANYILLVQTGADRRPTSTKLLRALDGMPVEGAVDVGKQLAAAKTYRAFGRTVLLSEATRDAPRVLRLLDLVTGKNIWRSEFDAKSIPIRSIGVEWVGMLKPTGEAELLSVQTGRPVATFKLDAKYAEAQVRDCAEVVLLTDSDRAYLILNRDISSSSGPGVVVGMNPAMMGFNRFNGYNTPPLRSLRVNGPMYCFDRGTGKRVWFAEDLLDNQFLLLDRFAELPVIVAGVFTADRGGQTFKVTVIEKERGLLRFNKGVAADNNFFIGMVVDPKAGTIDLLKNNLRISIQPDDKK